MNTGFISPQFHVIYDTKFQTVTGGYEENDAVANHIWDSLAHLERVNMLEEADREQEPLPNLHADWITPEERTNREERTINAEVMRWIQRRDHAISELPMTVEEHSAAHDISVARAMRNNPDFVGPRPAIPAEESEEDNIPTLKTNTPQRTRRYPRIAGNEPQYAGLYCSIEGEENVLDIDGASDVIHRDNCFLSTFEFDPSVTHTSPATRYLDSASYVSESGLVGNVHPYAFSAQSVDTPV